MLINEIFLLSFFTDLFWVYLAIPLLLMSGVYFSIKIKGAQILKVGLMFKLLFKKSEYDDKNISMFQSFAMSMAARVGVGSLAGIALGLKLGGYGILFWMWVVAIIGGANAFVESYLAQKYSMKTKDGSYGGAPYYIEKGLNMKKFAVLLAFITIITYGVFYPAIQSNTIVSSVVHITGRDDFIFKLIVGLFISLLLSMIIFGGAKSIAKVTEKVVPIMGIGYFLLGFYLLIIYYDKILPFFTLVITDAFDLNSIYGAGLMTVIIIGIKRGVFSNEAGMGTGSIAAASTRVDNPAESGFTQTLGVLITTLIIGTTTVFIIYSAGIDLNSFDSGINGIEITQAAMKFHFGDLGLIFLGIAIFLFAFSTILTGVYYTESNIIYVKGASKSINLSRIFIVIAVIISSVTSAGIIWDLADIGVAVMAAGNIIAIALLGKRLSKNIVKDIQLIDNELKHSIK